MTDSPQAAGGRARAQALTPEARREIARKAGRARWAGNVPSAAHISPAKLARQIEAEVAAIRHRQGNLRRLADTALGTVSDADKIVAALEQAVALLGKK